MCLSNRVVIADILTPKPVSSAYFIPQINRFHNTLCWLSSSVVRVIFTKALNFQFILCCNHNRLNFCCYPLLSSLSLSLTPPPSSLLSYHCHRYWRHCRSRQHHVSLIVWQLSHVHLVWSVLNGRAIRMGVSRAWDVLPWSESHGLVPHRVELGVHSTSKLFLSKGRRHMHLRNTEKRQRAFTREDMLLFAFKCLLQRDNSKLDLQTSKDDVDLAK